MIPGPGRHLVKELPTMNNPSWCDYHKGYQASKLVQIEERNSGPSFGFYACAPCRSVRGLTPVAEVEEPAQATK